MKRLKDYEGKLTDYPEEVQKQILNAFVNELILDLNASLTKGNVDHLQFRVHENTNKCLSIKYLVKIYTEIISNYKRYTPLCFASILTASKNLE